MVTTMRIKHALIVLLACVPLTAQAARFQRFGHDEVHYNIVPTGTLQPEIARRYHITRSRQRGLLTVAILRDGDPVRADVTATATDLNQQVREIDMREVREGQAIYYIGTFRANDGERLKFRITADTRRPDTDPYVIRFMQHFYAQ
ncbi:MAG TPA: DUF4426 domain-containing protein [Gammaproteobacteria bacterium]|nr:DUF4426 domain-containing protein [Gammaproteobacteria bacterium]